MPRSGIDQEASNDEGHKNDDGTARLPGPPLSRPTPATECGVCSALAKQRVEAETAGNFSAVADCNVELRNHPHRRASDLKLL